MRYVCSICGYIYDEEKEGAPFASLPDTWRCPWCGAGKKLFEPERKAEAPKAPSPAPAPAEEELTELPAGVLGTCCRRIWRQDIRQSAGLPRRKGTGAPSGCASGARR